MRRTSRSLYAHGCWVSIARPSRTPGCYETPRWYNATPASRSRIARFIIKNKSCVEWHNGIQYHEALNA